MASACATHLAWSSLWLCIVRHDECLHCCLCHKTYQHCLHHQVLDAILLLSNPQTPHTLHAYTCCSCCAESLTMPPLQLEEPPPAPLSEQELPPPPPPISLFPIYCIKRARAFIFVCAGAGQHQAKWMTTTGSKQQTAPHGGPMPLRGQRKPVPAGARHTP